VSNQSEEDAWRSIVDNYGERAHLEPPATQEKDDPPAPAPDPDRTAYPDAEAVEDAAEERFVPPPPPPLPHPPPVRLAAWLGLFGSPAVLLVALVLGIGLPSWVAYLLIGSFLGGFGYLVAHMQRGPRDPGDDGARL
jgi:hypothetical protein